MAQSHVDDGRPDRSESVGATWCAVTNSLRAMAESARSRLERSDNVPPHKRWNRSARSDSGVC